MTTIDTFGIIRNAKLIGENTTSPDAANALAMELARTVASTLSANDAQFNDIETAICRIAVATRMLNELRVFKSNLRFQSAIDSRPLADTLNPTTNALIDIVKQGEALLKTVIDSLT
jgi:hypothetical protein